MPIDEEEPESRESAAEHHRHARADPGGPAAGDRTGDDHRDRERREDERDLVAGEVRDQTQVERGEEEDREHREVRRKGDDVRRREGRIAQELQLEDRVAHALLDQDEDDDQHGCGSEEDVDPPGSVAPVLAFDHAEGRRHDRCRARGKPRHIEFPSRRVAALGERRGRHRERDGAEAEAEPEDPTPAGTGDEDAADHRPEREREPRHRRPYAESDGSLLALGIDVADERERPRLGGRRAETHHDPADDEGAGAMRDRGHDRAGAKDRDAREHHLLSAEQVAERAAGEHERGKREHVAVHDPLQAGDADAERRLDVGERDADDRVVEEGEEEDRADGCEGRFAGVTLLEQRESAHAEDVTTCRWPACCPGAPRACTNSRRRPSTCRSGESQTLFAAEARSPRT